MFRIHFYRWLVIPVCLMAGVLELLALQRSQWLNRKTSYLNSGISR